MGVAGAFEFMRYDSLKRIYAPIEDTAIINKLAISLSPAQLVTADDAPTLIIQGDKDRLVPVQQSERMKEEMGKSKYLFLFNISKAQNTPGKIWQKKEKNL